MKTKLKTKHPITSICIRGISFDVVDGMLTVSDDLVEELIPHGFERVVEEHRGSSRQSMIDTLLYREQMRLASLTDEEILAELTPESSSSDPSQDTKKTTMSGGTVSGPETTQKK